MKRAAPLCFAVALVLMAAPAMADLIYRPFNPGFGGFANNYDYFIGQAANQNKHAETGGGGGGGGAPDIVFPDITIDLGDTGSTSGGSGTLSSTPDFVVGN